MGFTEVRGIFEKEILEVRRDGRLSLVLLFLVPLLVYIICTFSIPSQPVVAVVGHSTEIPSLAESVELRYFLATEEEGLKMLEEGKVDAVVCFKNRGVDVFAENSYKGLEAIKSICSKIYGDIKTIYIHSRVNLVYLVVLGVIGQSIALLLASTAISGERETGTLEMLFASRLSAFDLISAKFLAISTISLIAVFLGVAILSLVAKYSVAEILLEILLVTASVGVGLIFSVTLSRVEGVLAATLFLIVNVILSLYGSFEDIAFVSYLSYLIPLLQLKIAFGSPENLLSGGLLLLLYTLVTISSALLIFEKKRSFAG